MLAKRRPFGSLRMLNRLGKESDFITSLLEDWSHFHGFSPFPSIENPDFSPSLDIVDKKDKLSITVEVPGIEKDNIQIDINDKTLIIKGEKKSEDEQKDKDVYVRERCYGAFRREIELPPDSDTDKIDASYKNGILVLDIPKKNVKEEKKTKKIEIK